MSGPSQCSLCGADTAHQSIHTTHVYKGRNDQAFYRCSSCDVVYLFPLFSQQEMDRFYASEFDGYMAERSAESSGWETPEQHVAANQQQLERRLKYLSPHRPKGKCRILEFGCSSGFMLYPFINEGHECIGVEPLKSYADFVRAKGIPCFNRIEDLKADPVCDEGFDLIMHFFVLEHMPDPLFFICQQIDLLREGGKLIIEIPNSSDSLATVYNIGAFERFYWSVVHPWYFSETSFRFLLNQLELDYEIILDQRYDLSNHMVWARDGEPGGMGRFTDIIGQDTEDNYRQALIRSGHCDTIIAVISK
mgnify:CR=1 FL=1|tara:strand:+ start:522 stop:1439 length:918 start_codon:yes stop_codon:yes gene_type:complete